MNRLFMLPCVVVSLLFLQPISGVACCCVEAALPEPSCCATNTDRDAPAPHGCACAITATPLVAHESDAIVDRGSQADAMVYTRPRTLLFIFSFRTDTQVGAGEPVPPCAGPARYLQLCSLLC